MTATLPQAPGGGHPAPPAAPDEPPKQERLAREMAAAIPRRPGAVVRQVVSDFRLLRATKYGIGPLGVIFVLEYIQRYDTTIRTLLLPEIRADFNLTLTELTLYQKLFGLFGLLLIPLMGWLTDRANRTKILSVSAILSGAFSFLTAFAPSGVHYTAFSSLDAAGENIDESPKRALLYDYYPLEARAKVESLRTVAFAVAGIATPWVVALVGQRYGWRWCLYLVSPCLFLVGLWAWGRMPEPVRGYWERLRAGEEEATAELEQPPMRFGEALRTLWSIRTFRRLAFIMPILGMADTAFGTLYTLYIVEQFRLEPTERALLSTPSMILGLVAIVIGGGLADLFIKNRPGRVLAFTAVIGLATAASQVIVVLFPSLILVVGFGVLFSTVSALVRPAQAAVASVIIPARLRGQGIAAIAVMFIPLIPLSTLPAYVADRYGIRQGLLFFAPLYLVGAAVQIASARWVDFDQRAAIAAANATNEYNRAKAEGRIKLLLLRDVDVEYSGVQVLFNVDLDVAAGEMVALLGTNGAGKSTLLRAVSGIQEASNGAIFFDGRDITHVPPHEIARLGIVHMPGGRSVFPSLTVRENLDLARQEAGDDGDERLARVFEFFPVLHERLDQPAGSLSGGEQQMVGLAQAFLWKPRLLMIDELSLGLAPAVVGELLDVVRTINAEGATVILVEQSVNVALTLAERAVFMEKGEIRFDGPTAELLRRPDVMRAVYLKGSAAAAGTGRRREPRPQASERSRPILEVADLTLSYGGNLAVDGVRFTLHEGEALGLIGPNGAGKTTIFDLISGFQKPDRGTVVFDGVDITRMPPDERGRLGLVRRFQDAKLFQSLTVFEAVCVALDKELPVRNTFVTALQVGAARRGEARLRARADRLIEMLELEAFRDKFVSDLSTGVRRVVDLACVLAADPRVLLLDEPSSGIAQAEAEGLAPLLRRVRYETGCSLLIIEHDMPLITAVSDELLALAQGRVVTRGAPEDVLEHPVVVESYLGTSEEAVNRSGVIKP